ncbi:MULTISPECIES: aspartate/ornithine carbamoyltransferase family protein [Jonquetella]|uniref:Aspartate carbamoyltransferase, catalytic chain n=1 Tax=Jonquetella anthropi DSM 22815 TaxID=885272 RepID=H0UKW5_9BACT|nr:MULTISPECIES: aspartate carbamoyltransferase [Jonquetella]EEX47881.1 Aspartate/ornithine carbamoyltransferase, carbamoyl-P binding domain protein [Jonquetella anthropi E3_33 E1]EHM13324.1 aspartate carbamoyltransferase, catalytic chain [Jonquetella anthropi DSM 22815]ERL23550.1 aspartate/ornithine carbamoyltransferase, carbamoyl-P-binding domain protein [Jonquetella sp. BV3C21]
MALTANFAPMNIKDELEATGLKGRNLEFLTDLTREQYGHLFRAAEMIEPFWRNGLNLMEGKVLCALFFQPSTRTRFSTELAMLRQGGRVISESNPAVNSSAAKGESLSDHLTTASCYADIIGLRHPDYETVKAALPAARVPVISCGWGNETHPTQGLLDMYTAYRAFGGFEGLRVCIASSDLSRARSGHSFAMGLAIMGAEIVYVGLSEHPIPTLIMDKLKAAGAKIETHYDLSREDFIDVMATCHLCYLPGCCVPKDNPAARNDFMEKIAKFYIHLEDLKKIRGRTGRIVGLMHSLPRNEVEFDYAIDHSEFELYFKQMSFSVPIRMALVSSMVGVN